MTTARQEAITILEKIPEDKLSFVIQILQGIDGLFRFIRKKMKGKKEILGSLLCQQQKEARMQMNEKSAMLQKGKSKREVKKEKEIFAIEKFLTTMPIYGII